MPIRKVGRKAKKRKFLTALYYSSIGLAASLFLFLLLYWSLSLNSNIYSLINNTKSEPIYLWTYAVLTIGTIILFGVNIPLLLYRIRKFGLPKFRTQAGSGLGAFVGVLASACPVCGSFLLSVVGITAGLAAFPFQGLELKALSFGLMALPVWLTSRELKNPPCDNEGNCIKAKDASFKTKDYPILAAFLFLILVLLANTGNMLKNEPIFYGNKLNSANTAPSGNKLYDETVEKVFPKTGFQSKIALGYSVLKLVEYGVIDREKFETLYKDRGGLPVEFQTVLDQPRNEPILLTRENANYYINILWALGLANYMSANNKSPILGKSLFNFASTGGWNLGKEENGGAYFNKFEIVKLTPDQEALVTKIAQNTYRPCCDNSTFFQDCNHGSALLGLLELGASQGLSEDQLYKEALAFNSHWFPHNYIQTALYFKVKKNIAWENVDAKEVMGYEYSAVSRWVKNVQTEIAKIPDLIPKTQGGAGCGV